MMMGGRGMTALQQVYLILVSLCRGALGLYKIPFPELWHLSFIVSQSQDTILVYKVLFVLPQVAAASSWEEKT